MLIRGEFFSKGVTKFSQRFGIFKSMFDFSITVSHVEVF